MPIWLIQIVVGIVLSVAATLAQQAFAPKPKSSTSTASGTRDTVTTGGTNPQSFVIGTFGLPGQLEYDNAYGSSGGTPNAYRVRVISLGDLPITGLTGLYEAGQAMTLATTGHVDQGYPVAERKDGSTDCFWWEFHDGTQTTADAFLSATFGSDADRPWTSEMVGRGIPYITLTALYDRKVWNAVPDCMMQVQGIPLYDPRKDTTAGGLGSQRLDDQSTWAFTDNLAVMIYNILVGIRYENSIIWGGRCAQTQLPYANWAAAMDACDADIDLVAGGTEKQFRGGLEVKLSDKPADIINDFLIAANARISEAAGVYTILVGAPGSADFTFTDADTIVTEQAQLDPFPNLDNTVNGATGQYLEPTEAWASKDTAPYYRSDLETADRDRRQANALTLTPVFSGTQAQRILKATVEEARRFAKHVIPLVPVFGTYRPLQLGAWTSDANGYSSKLFLVTAWTEASNGNVTFGLQEIDPTDHDWTPASDEKALSFAPLTPVTPAAQDVADFSVGPYTITGTGAVPFKAAIQMFWNGTVSDVRALLYEVRLADSGDVVLTGEFATQFASGSGTTPGGALKGSTDYEARGKYDPFSARETNWSSWEAVTTPAVSDADVSDLQVSQLGTELTNAYGIVTTDTPGSIVDQLGQIVAQVGDLAQALVTVSDTSRKKTTALVQQTATARAAILTTQEAVTTEAAARATAITEALAQVGNVLADGFAKIESSVDLDTATVDVLFKVKAAVGDLVSTAGMLLRSSVNGATGELEAVLAVLGKLYVQIPGGDGSLITAIETLDDGTVKFSGTRMGRIDALDGSGSYIDLSGGIKIVSHSVG
jgi:hypothetical protein